MRKIRFSLVFNRLKKLNKYGEGLVQIRAYQNPKNRYFTTDVYILPKQWNNKRTEIKNHPNEYRLNKKIHQQIADFKSFEIDNINFKGFCALDELSEFGRSKGQPSFFEFYASELKTSAINDASRQAQQNTLNKLKKYRKQVCFRDLTYKLIDNFDGYLRKCKLSTNSIAKHHKDLKKYINLAIKKDYLSADRNPYKRFKIRREESQNRTFLTMAEVQKLEALEFDFTEQHLELIRDMFLFSCFTGLRYSDLIRIDKESILEHDRGLFLQMQSQKTKKNIALPLYNLFKLSSIML